MGQTTWFCQARMPLERLFPPLERLHREHISSCHIFAVISIVKHKATYTPLLGILELTWETSLSPFKRESRRRSAFPENEFEEPHSWGNACLVEWKWSTNTQKINWEAEIVLARCETECLRPTVIYSDILLVASLSRPKIRHRLIWGVRYLLCLQFPFCSSELPFEHMLDWFNVRLWPQGIGWYWHQAVSLFTALVKRRRTFRFWILSTPSTVCILWPMILAKTLLRQRQPNMNTLMQLSPSRSGSMRSKII